MLLLEVSQYYITQRPGTETAPSRMMRRKKRDENHSPPKIN
jgi:hypothetical protein